FVLDDALSSAARERSCDANDDSTFTRGGRCHQMLAHLDSKGKLLRADPSAHAAHQTLVVALIIAETESRNGGLRYRRKPLVRQHVSLSQPTRRWLEAAARQAGEGFPTTNRFHDMAFQDELAHALREQSAHLRRPSPLVLHGAKHASKVREIGRWLVGPARRDPVTAHPSSFEPDRLRLGIARPTPAQQRHQTLGANEHL